MAHKIMNSHYILLFLCLVLYEHNINSIKFVALNKHIFNGIIKMDEVICVPYGSEN